MIILIPKGDAIPPSTCVLEAGWILNPSLRLKLTSIDPDITPLPLSMIGLIFNVCLSTFSFKPKHSLYSDLMALTAVFFNTEYVVFL